MKNIGYITTGFIAGILLFLLVGAALINKPVFLVDESKLGFIETIEKIEELSKAEGWTVSHMYNLQATMERNNFEVLPVVVMSLCKPQLAYKILGSDTERPASALMPCRVSVYQTEDGKVMISRMNSTILLGMLSGMSNRAMSEAGSEIEMLLKHVTK
jgi:uncharacterized protein (DUF302 family)